uniref:Uncharacterized protein n=1 Tax=Panagrolaimus davidi TaxID=227884 RepID=A0A914QGM0_9BILA
MYKVTAYKVTLKKRHQIVENVKVLAFAFPSILIYTLLAPMGAIITIIAMSLKFSSLPPSIGHIFSNLPHIIICIRLILINRKSEKHGPVKVVKNALGKSLPVVLTNDKYFKDLKQQWK